MVFLKWLVGLTVLGLVLAAGAAAWTYHGYQRFLREPLNLDTSTALQVPAGSGVGRLAAVLEQRGIIGNALWLRLHIRLRPEHAAIKTGEYSLQPPLTITALLDQLTQGIVVQYTLTIPEGWTFRQLRQAISAHPQLQQTIQGGDDASVMAAIGHPNVHPEGLFFPDTYHFPRLTTDTEFLARAFSAMQGELADAWSHCTTQSPLKSPYDVLIMASIIERETGQADERPAISGVFDRRLRKGMRLQTDPTVIYGLGDAFDGNLRRRDLRADTPYNTYTRAGLPPTPIALPGRAALVASCEPAAGNSLYFVATGDGGHAFSATLAEHNRNVRKYQLKR